MYRLLRDMLTNRPYYTHRRQIVVCRGTKIKLSLGIQTFRFGNLGLGIYIIST